ncbi:uncharacterized protein SETTUDRAFT_24539 [Exserohilum turcica Et28A]|uniref:Uncharacterized protein n=1 Tax=Exserohilum turcicum (strain 28A) TaxID=671987 RepID=R0JU30_EXST2|nr:uncharacterized protein SETTUDRAFT_24539 [Exserohilum turcica Et28A]EOA81029.1 hypothetical protein SETTUDRAFT_24539 [Exserohilum turcica Et28A]
MSRRRIAFAAKPPYCAWDANVAETLDHASFVNGGYHVDTLYVGRFTGASLVPCGIDVKGHIPVVNDLELGSIS